ncbi:helix-turn-helix transcriptional regulator [Hymenobacter terricola]|uniref:helix-turn-helix transcriptional regulator n=1 Tax=Hymenobacter terricola TaxID=2819236 RepID=UPI001B3044E5|nr:AraC family transcriptional regulator [Hymenobacter terricola]
MPDLFPTYRIGHFLNEPDNPTAFEVTRFEQMVEPDVEDPHRHTFYEVLWTDAGLSRQAIDGVAYEVRCGTLFFISPGQLHLFEEYEHLGGGSVMFTEDFFLLGGTDRDRLFELSFLDNIYANPLLPLDKEAFGEVRQTIAALEAEARRPDRSAVICQSLLQVLLAQIQRCVDHRAGAAAPARRYVVLYKQFKALLDAHYLDHLTAADYAARLAVTPHHLNVVSKQVSGGRTTGEVIRARPLLEAKRLLAFTELPVAEVAAQLRFGDPSYFARVFRAETGLSPAAYQRAMAARYRPG